MAQQTKVGRTATTISTDEQGLTRVIYHSTPVVTFNRKIIVLNHGGWMTNTTKARMNQASHQFNLGYSVYQKDRNWYVRFKNQVMPFDSFGSRTIELVRDGYYDCWGYSGLTEVQFTALPAIPGQSIPGANPATTRRLRDIIISLEGLTK